MTWKKSIWQIFFCFLFEYSFFFNVKFKRRNSIESESIVAELVHGFLIPETQKEVHRQQCELNHLYNSELAIF